VLVAVYLVVERVSISVELIVEEARVVEVVKARSVSVSNSIAVKVTMFVWVSTIVVLM